MSFFWRFGKFEEICNSVKFFFQRGKKGYCDADLWELNNWFSSTFPKMLRELSKVTLSYPVGFDLSDEKDSKAVIRPQTMDGKNEDEEYLAWKVRLNEMADLFEKTHTTGGWSPTPEAQECCDKGFELLHKHFFDLWW